MKVAISFRRMDTAAGRMSISLTGHQPRKVQRLLKSRSTPGAGPASEEFLRPQLVSSSPDETILLAQQGDATAFETIPTSLGTRPRHLPAHAAQPSRSR